MLTLYKIDVNVIKIMCRQNEFPQTSAHYFCIFLYPYLDVSSRR